MLLLLCQNVAKANVFKQGITVVMSDKQVNGHLKKIY